MIAFKQIVVVKDTDRVVLSVLPFRRGQRIENVMITEEERPDSRIDPLNRALRAAQALPAAQEQIAEEIAAHRAQR